MPSGQGPQLLQGETAAATLTGDQHPGPHALGAWGTARFLGAQSTSRAGPAQRLRAVVWCGRPSVWVVGARESRMRSGRPPFAQPYCGHGSSICLHGLALPFRTYVPITHS